MNEEIISTSSKLKDGLKACDEELRDIQLMLDHLYDVLETGKLNLNELAPRIKELTKRQDELNKLRVQIEADMVVQGVEEIEKIKYSSTPETLRTFWMSQT